GATLPGQSDLWLAVVQRWFRRAGLQPHCRPAGRVPHLTLRDHTAGTTAQQEPAAETGRGYAGQDCRGRRGRGRAGSCARESSGGSAASPAPLGSYAESYADGDLRRTATLDGRRAYTDEEMALAAGASL